MLRAARRVLRAGRRNLPRGQRPAGLVLLYHRVADVETDPWDLCVSPKNFAAHLDVLQERGICRAVRDLMQELRNGAGRPAFAVTFDDGYADNATAALPILAERDVPATIFVVSRAVGAVSEFWWDALERIVLRPGNLPEKLTLHIAGREHCWELGNARRYSVEAFRSQVRWRVEDDRPAHRRQELFLELWRLLVGLPFEEREQTLRHILDWAGIETDARPDYRRLSKDELTALASSNLIEIGAHTRTHLCLPDLPRKLQSEEITGSKMDLEAAAGRPVVSFSYPHGRFTHQTKRAARAAGFAFACTCVMGGVRRRPDPLALPRIQVKDWDGSTFRRVVTSYL